MNLDFLFGQLPKCPLVIIGRRRISRFIESVIRPHVLKQDLLLAYQQMAREEAREAEALEWAEATGGEVADETR